VKVLAWHFVRPPEAFSRGSKAVRGGFAHFAARMDAGSYSSRIGNSRANSGS
jgi:hypothetical protein